MISKVSHRKDNKSSFGDIAKYIANLSRTGPIPQGREVASFEAGKTPFDELSAYISDSKAAGKKVGLLLVTNCLHDEYDLAVAEIKATQALNKRAKSNKTYHLIVSFRENENPSPEMIKEVEEAFCDALGFSDHQRITALHVNTENPHIHIAINKIHPKTFRLHEPYYDYYTRDGVCRKMELKYGLEVDNGVDFDGKSKNQAVKKGLSSDAAAMEKHSGLMSFETWVKEAGPAEALGKVLKSPDASWDLVHRALSEYDLVMRKRGAGLVISSRSGKLFVKASDVLREAGKGAIEKKLGVYAEPSAEILRAKAEEQYHVRVLHNHGERDALYRQYQKERAERETRKTLDLQSLREKRSARLLDISGDFARRRERVRRDSLLGKQRKRSVYSKLGEERLKAVNAVVADTCEKRRSIYAENKGFSWQDYLIREAVTGNDVALRVLRSNSKKVQNDTARDSFAGDQRQTPDFLYRNLSSRVCKNGDVFYQVDGGVIRDEGGRISVENMSDQGLEMALRMSKIRFGNLLNIDGSQEFKARVVQVAARSGIEIEFSGPEMEATRKALLYDPRKEPGVEKTVGQTVRKAKDKEKGMEVEEDKGPELDF